MLTYPLPAGMALESPLSADPFSPSSFWLCAGTIVSRSIRIKYAFDKRESES